MIKSFKNLFITDKLAIIILQILFIYSMLNIHTPIYWIPKILPDLMYSFPFKLEALGYTWIIIMNLVFLIMCIKKKSFVFWESKFTSVAIHISLVLYLLSEIFFIINALQYGNTPLMVFSNRVWWLNLFAILILLLTASYWVSLLKKKSIIDELTVKKGLSAVSILLLILLVYSVVKAYELPKCDSIFAERQVKKIFEQNELDNPNLSKIEMDMMVPEKFDKDLNKYECSARLSVVTIQHIYDKNPHTAEYTADYTIYKERGKNKVVSSFRRR